MTKPTKYRQHGKSYVFNALRREILAARLKVALGELLGRTPSPQVTRLSRMELAPIAGRHQRVDDVTVPRTYDPTDRDQVLSTLRGEILAAQLKEALDEELGRETSPAVKRLARMELPPITRSNDRDEKVTYRRTYDRNDPEQVAAVLRKEIRAARLKMTLDKKQGRETSPQVKLLAGLTLPPLVRQRRPNAAEPASQDGA